MTEDSPVKPPALVFARVTADWEEMKRGARYATKASRKDIYRLLLIGAAASIAVSALYYAKDHDPILLGLPVIIMPAFFLYLRLLGNRQVKQSFRTLVETEPTHEWQFDAERYYVGSGTSGSWTSWERAHRFVCTPGGFLLYPDSGYFHWLPFSAFRTPEDAETVRRFARARVKDFKVQT